QQFRLLLEQCRVQAQLASAGAGGLVGALGAAGRDAQALGPCHVGAGGEAGDDFHGAGCVSLGAAYLGLMHGVSPWVGSASGSCRSPRPFSRTPADYATT